MQALNFIDAVAYILQCGFEIRLLDNLSSSLKQENRVRSNIAMDLDHIQLVELELYAEENYPRQSRLDSSRPGLVS